MFYFELIHCFIIVVSQNSNIFQEYRKLDLEMEDVSQEKQTQSLRKKVAVARLELTAKDKELGAVGEQKVGLSYSYFVNLQFERIKGKI